MSEEPYRIIITGRSPRVTRVRAINPLTFPTCYVCGNPLDSSTTRDHVPPKQFFPKAFRRANATDQLEWLPTHRSCNQSYQRDEECFVHTFGLPATPLTTAGYALGHDIRERYFKGQQRPLVTSVMNEFVPRTNTKAFETGRTNRIAWKIVRGLHCLRTGTILPERARIDGGFTCDKTTFLTQELGPRLHAGGFQDEWEGSLPMIFKTMTLIDESPEHTTYTYFLVCWEYLAYFLWFATKDGHLLQTA